MTTYYFNNCIPAFRYDPMNPSWNVESYKKGMVGEIFVIYLLYLAIICIGTMKNKYRESGKYSDSAEGDGKDPQKQDNRALVEKLNYYEFDRFFYPYFGFHTISVGMAMLYAPYAFEIAITWIHFLFYVIMLFLRVKYGDEKKKIVFGLYAFLQILNLTLILSSLISLGAEKNCNW